jgi:hypothetical protein
MLHREMMPHTHTYQLHEQASRFNKPLSRNLTCHDAGCDVGDCWHGRNMTGQQQHRDTMPPAYTYQLLQKLRAPQFTNN